MKHNLIPVRLGKMISVTLIVLLWISACKNSNQNASSNDIKEDSTHKTQKESPLPIIPEDEFRALYDNTTEIDFIFHQLSISVNQTEKGSIQSTIAGITKNPIIKDNCRSLGRMFCQSEGNTLMEVEIYFDPDRGCRYYTFYKDGNATYVSGIGDGAVNFYQSLINNSKQLQNQSSAQ